jgi:hypothetical protein
LDECTPAACIGSGGLALGRIKISSFRLAGRGAMSLENIRADF